MDKPEETRYLSLMNSSIIKVFIKALKFAVRKPKYFTFLIKTFLNQKKAANRRIELIKQGVSVPAFLITSITGKCNLTCKGCYAKENKKHNKKEIDIEKLENIFAQASEAGISIILVAGGEPLLKTGIIEVMSKFNNIIFVIFTNGLLLNKDNVKLIEKSKNIITVFSIEGYENSTDFRRGKGIFSTVCEKIELMKHCITGISFTITKENISEITDQNFINKLKKCGVDIFFFVEYIPVKPGTEHLVPDKQSLELLDEKLEVLKKKTGKLFFSFPGDEEKYGGCLSSGRGFIHVNQYAEVEPCPFAPYNAADLNHIPLLEAINNDFLKSIRENKELIEEVHTGCALWKNRDYVKELYENTVKKNKKV